MSISPTNLLQIQPSYSLVGLAVSVLVSAAAAKASEIYQSTVKDGGCDSFSGQCNFFAEASARDPNHPSCLPTPVDPYLSGSTNSARLNKTPAYVYRMPHPGIVYAPKGNFGYFMPTEKLITDAKFKSLTDNFVNNPKLQRELEETYCAHHQETNHDKGCTVYQTDELAVLAQVSPSKIENHRRALEFLKTWVGQIDTLPDSTILNNLLETHRLLDAEMVDTPKQRAGSYRNSDVMVFQESADKSLSGLVSSLRKNGGTQADVSTLKNYLKRLATNSDSSSMTPKERKVLSLIAFVPCSAEDIPQEMIKFIRNWKESLIEMKRCGNVDPIALAAYAHHQIGSIHPFANGNGRVARALMNAILMEYGVAPLVFLNDAMYTAAVEENAKKEGSFSHYLQTEAKKLPEIKRNLNLRNF